MKIFWLFTGLLIFASTAIYYYQRQYTGNKLGGSISRAKTAWLFWALFYYFFLSFWIFTALPKSDFTFILKIFIILIFFRATMQPVLLYITKNWTPLYGITFNILTGLVLISLISRLIMIHEVAKSATDRIYLMYLSGVILALFVDSYYANVFHRIIGQGTKGDDAIWYASEQDKRFKRINQITFYNNFFFFTLLILIILQIINL